MANYRNERKGVKIRNTVIAILSAISILACGALGFMIARDDTNELSWVNYSVCTVEDEGKLDKDGATSLMSGFLKVEHLEISVIENPSVTYTLHFYDADEKWLSESSALSVDLETAIEGNADLVPEDAKFVRVEITPTDDNYISLFEISEYSSQVKVVEYR